LPAFMAGGADDAPNSPEIAAALELTGHFFESRVFRPQKRELPASRTRFVVRLKG